MTMATAGSSGSFEISKSSTADAIITTESTIGAPAEYSEFQRQNRHDSNRLPITTTLGLSASGVPEDEWHPGSKWQEQWTEDELTLYDIHREPLSLEPHRQLPSEPPPTIRCRLKLLEPEFQCVICLQYMKDPMIVMECLHRFCSECIQKCLRLGKNECPTCRAPIPSRRSLRRDFKWSVLIRNIVTNSQTGSLPQQQHQGASTSTPDMNHIDGVKTTLSKRQRSPGSCSNNDSPPKRARTLQDAIVEKRKAMQLRQGLQQQNRRRELNAPQIASEHHRHHHKNTSKNGELFSSKHYENFQSIHNKTLTPSCIQQSPNHKLVEHTEHDTSASLKLLYPHGPHHFELSPLVDVQLVRHIHEYALESLVRPYLTLRGDATMQVLQHFLSKKLNNRIQADDLELFVLVYGDDDDKDDVGGEDRKLIRLDNNVSLFQARDTSGCLRGRRIRDGPADYSPALGFQAKPFILHYKASTSSFQRHNDQPEQQQQHQQLQRHEEAYCPPETP